MESTKLIMFDLDKTLINEDYDLTDNAIYDAVGNAVQRGWKVGLNSDTPYEMLKLWRNKLGMNGPIVAERGAVVEYDNDVEYSADLARKVSYVTSSVINYFSERSDTTVFTGNATELVKGVESIDEDTKMAVFINTVSICSVRFFVRWRNSSGRLFVDENATNNLWLDVKRDCLPALNGFEEDYNPRFGLVILRDPAISKRTGTKKILNKMCVAKCVMVGDTMADYLGDDIAWHFAVANAGDDYRSKAMSLGKPLTAGCVEILNGIDDEYACKLGRNM